MQLKGMQWQVWTVLAVGNQEEPLDENATPSERNADERPCFVSRAVTPMPICFFQLKPLDVQ
jgi:hypothetical protein